jgi:hypothetical protein
MRVCLRVHVCVHVCVRSSEVSACLFRPQHTCMHGILVLMLCNKNTADARTSNLEHASCYSNPALQLSSLKIHTIWKIHYCFLNIYF